MDKAQSFAMQYGYYDKGKKKACCVGYNAGYKQAEKDTIERAIEWLKANAYKYTLWNEDDYCLDYDETSCINDFRNFMEGKK